MIKRIEREGNLFVMTVQLGEQSQKWTYEREQLSDGSVNWYQIERD